MGRGAGVRPVADPADLARPPGAGAGRRAAAAVGRAGRRAPRGRVGGGDRRARRAGAGAGGRPRRLDPGRRSRRGEGHRPPLRSDHGSDTRPTLYLAHPSGGDVLCYAELSRLLDPRVDVVALADPELSGAAGPGPETVAGIAGQYLAALKEVGGCGPWLLGGWSMGGSVAQEMARQLHADGEKVALLVMLDSNDPALIRNVPGHDAAEIEWQVALRHLRALEAFLGIDLDTDDALTGLPLELRLAAAADRLREHRLLGRGEDLAGRLRVFARHLRALAAHTPRTLPDSHTQTLLVRADRPSPATPGSGWASTAPRQGGTISAGGPTWRVRSTSPESTPTTTACCTRPCCPPWPN
ncbi:thioesterase domain-containing protein [Nonomuraea recticatena]|uniref:thioesterase domain-containing protein n=1 Tax=Nonomuraea recticatena TaxID=46178 RepID=UPI00360CE380